MKPLALLEKDSRWHQSYHGCNQKNENGKEETNNESGQFHKALKRTVAVVSSRRKDFRFKGSFVMSNNRQGVWQVYILKVSQGLVTCTYNSCREHWQLHVA